MEIPDKRLRKLLGNVVPYNNEGLISETLVWSLHRIYTFELDLFMNAKCYIAENIIYGEVL